MNSPENLERVIAHSVEFVLESLGLPVMAVGSDKMAQVTPDFVADIGFNGDDLKGLLRLTCTQTVVSATYPLKKKKIEPGDTKVYNDWMCEIANQVLGRIKLECKKYGVKTTIGIPSIVKAEDELFLPFQTNCKSTFVFQGINAYIAITFVAALGPNVKFDRLIQDEFAVFVQNSEDSFFS